MTTLAIHGIWTKARSVSWVEQFEHAAALRLDVRPRIYGWASGVLSCFKWYRDRIVRAEAEYIKQLLNGDQVNVIAHSFGGYITWSLLTEYGFKFNKIILIAPAAPEDTDWHDYDDSFKQIRVYWSKNDEIIGRAHYGHMGKVGARVYHPRVESIETGLKHSAYMTPVYYEEWIKFLGE